MKYSKNINIARRYATSLIELNKEKKVSFEEIQNSLNNVREILNNSKDLCNVLNNPIISALDKNEIIEEVFSKDTDNITRNFIKLLIEKNRFDIIFSIIDIFSSLIDEFNNTINVDVTCAIELNEENKNKIQTKLNEKLHKSVNIAYKINQDIIAGLVYKIGDNVIDTSLSHRLEELKKEIIK